MRHIVAAMELPDEKALNREGREGTRRENLDPRITRKSANQAGLSFAPFAEKTFFASLRLPSRP
jgi:hypothetical protein